MSNIVTVDLTLKQLDELLSDRISLITPVIEFIRNSVQDKENKEVSNEN